MKPVHRAPTIPPKSDFASVGTSPSEKNLGVHHAVFHSLSLALKVSIEGIVGLAVALGIYFRTTAHAEELSLLALGLGIGLSISRAILHAEFTNVLTKSIAEIQQRIQQRVSTRLENSLL